MGGERRAGSQNSRTRRKHGIGKAGSEGEQFSHSIQITVVRMQCITSKSTRTDSRQGGREDHDKNGEGRKKEGRKEAKAQSLNGRGKICTERERDREGDQGCSRWASSVCS